MKNKIKVSDLSQEELKEVVEMLLEKLNLELYNSSGYGEKFLELEDKKN